MMAQHRFPELYYIFVFLASRYYVSESVTIETTRLYPSSDITNGLMTRESLQTSGFYENTLSGSYTFNTPLSVEYASRTHSIKSLPTSAEQVGSPSWHVTLTSYDEIAPTRVSIDATLSQEEQSSRANELSIDPMVTLSRMTMLESSASFFRISTNTLVEERSVATEIFSKMVTKLQPSMTLLETSIEVVQTNSQTESTKDSPVLSASLSFDRSLAIDKTEMTYYRSSDEASIFTNYTLVDSANVPETSSFSTTISTDFEQTESLDLAPLDKTSFHLQNQTREPALTTAHKNYLLSASPSNDLNISKSYAPSTILKSDSTRHVMWTEVYVSSSESVHLPVNTLLSPIPISSIHSTSSNIEMEFINSTTDAIKLTPMLSTMVSSNIEMEFINSTTDAIKLTPMLSTMVSSNIEMEFINSTTDAIKLTPMLSTMVSSNIEMEFINSTTDAIKLTPMLSTMVSSNIEMEFINSTTDAIKLTPMLSTMFSKTFTESATEFLTQIISSSLTYFSSPSVSTTYFRSSEITDVDNLKKFAVRGKLDEQYSEKLADENSEAFKNLSTRLNNQFLSNFGQLGLKDSKINGFSPGSIIFDATLSFDPASSIDTSRLAENLAASGDILDISVEDISAQPSTRQELRSTKSIFSTNEFEINSIIPTASLRNERTTLLLTNIHLSTSYLSSLLTSDDPGVFTISLSDSQSIDRSSSQKDAIISSDIMSSTILMSSSITPSAVFISSTITPLISTETIHTLLATSSNGMGLQITPAESNIDSTSSGETIFSSSVSYSFETRFSLFSSFAFISSVYSLNSRATDWSDVFSFITPTISTSTKASTTIFTTVTPTALNATIVPTQEIITPTKENTTVTYVTTTPTSISTTTPTTPTILVDNTYQYMVTGKLINEVFTDQLKNQKSSEFMRMASKVVEEIEKSLPQSGLLRTDVTAFISGSVIFYALLYFDPSSTLNNLKITNLLNGNRNLSIDSLTERCTMITCVNASRGSCEYDSGSITGSALCRCKFGFTGTRCQFTQPINGTGYDEWSPWSGCSTSCNNGTRNRTRECVPTPIHGGVCVVGPLHDFMNETCNLGECEVADEHNEELVIAGIICAVVFICIIILLIWICFRPKHNKPTHIKHAKASPLRDVKVKKVSRLPKRPDRSKNEDEEKYQVIPLRFRKLDHLDDHIIHNEVTCVKLNDTQESQNEIDNMYERELKTFLTKAPNMSSTSV